MVVGRGWVLLLAATLLPAGAAGQPRTDLTLEHRQVVLRADGNELGFPSRAPVAYTSLGDLMAAIEHPLPGGMSALRLSRRAPPETIDYVLAVTEEGRLVVGEQLRRYDYAVERYTFVYGSLSRSYSPLERPGPWTWLVEVPLSRERWVMLELQAATGWPVTAVTINSIAQP